MTRRTLLRSLAGCAAALLGATKAVAGAAATGATVRYHELTMTGCTLEKQGDGWVIVSTETTLYASGKCETVVLRRQLPPCPPSAVT